MPLWLSIILALGAMVYFRHYFEAVLLFGLADLLYGVPEVRFLGFIFSSLVLAVLFFLIIEFIKKNSMFYNKYND